MEMSKVIAAKHNIFHNKRLRFFSETVL